MGGGRRLNDPSARLRVAALASAQHGVVHLDQALDLGMSRDAVYGLTRRGEWRRLLYKVFATHVPGDARRQWPMAACLWGGEGSAASHRCAGELWALEGVPTGFVEIVRAGASLVSNDRVIVHRVLATFPIHRVDGIPVTSATKTLVDLSAVLSPERLELALEDALRRRLTSIPRLEMALRAAKGDRGTRLLRRLVDARLGSARPSDSMFEVKLRQLLEREGFPSPQSQYVVPLAGGEVRLDFAYPTARVGIEADSYRWHSSRGAWAKDRMRLNALVAAGWHILHVTYDELRRGAPTLLADLRRLLGRRPLFDE